MIKTKRMCSSNIKKILKLAAFDFDHTIINSNSDIYIDKILLEKTSCINKKSYEYPVEVENKHDSNGGWTERMNAVFEYMFSKYGVKGKDLLECLEDIKIDDSMIDLIKLLKNNGYELIILSDANSLFIETILLKNNLFNFFDKIYTNKAFIDENECLVVKPLNQIYNQNGEPFKCSTGFCTSNICKGTIFNDHLNKLLPDNFVEHLLFVGDGRNDYCGGLSLNKNNHFCVRKNFNLSKLLSKKENMVKSIRADIVYWDSAHDIIENLKNVIIN